MLNQKLKDQINVFLFCSDRNYKLVLCEFIVRGDVILTILYETRIIVASQPLNLTPHMKVSRR